MERLRLAVAEAVAQADDLPLLALEVQQRGSQLVEIGLMNQFVFDRRLLDRQAIADGLAQRDVLAAGAAGVERAEHLGWERKRPRRIGEHVHQRLAHPPDGVRDELDVARGIEAPRRFDESEIAFVDEIEERHAEAAIPFRVRDDEAQIGFDEPRDRGLVAVGADARAERALLVDRQARQLPDRAQVRGKRW